MPHEHPKHTSELELLKNLDQAAGEFESCWIRADGQFRVEDFLNQHQDLPADRLTREIVEVEIELRFNTGEVPTAAEYASRFPILDRRWLDKVIESATANSQTDEQKTLHPENDDWSGAPNPVGDSDKSTLDPANKSGDRHPAPKFTSFGDYEIIEEIARGGMGVVYKAQQKSLNRTVALKMILSGHLAGDEEIQRFHAEAEAAANLDHPGIVPIYEIGEHDSHQYFSMGFVQGQSLQAKLIDGPLPPREAAALAKKIAEAIAYAHERRVIHRDLKPANVLIDANGEPRVTDFGLAKQLGSDSDLTGTGQILGTPSFMPPEQALGQKSKVDERSDVWALGAILYNLITGRPPFQASTPMDTLKQVLAEEPVPPSKLNPNVPRDLETICLKCLEKESIKRYDGAAALIGELGRFLANEPIFARPAGRIEKTWRWCKRKPAKAVALALGILLVMTLAVGGPFIAIERSGFAKTQKRLADDANDARERVSENLRVVQASRLAGLSQSLFETDSNLALLLAAESVKSTVDYQQPVEPIAKRVLVDALSRIGGVPTDNISRLSNGNWAVAWTSDEDSVIRLWDLRKGARKEPSMILECKGRLRDIALSAKANQLVALCEVYPVVESPGKDSEKSPTPPKDFPQPDYRLYHWNLDLAEFSTRVEQCSVDSDSSYNFKLSDNGRWLAVDLFWYEYIRATAKNGQLIWDLSKGLDSTPQFMSANDLGVDFSPDDKLALLYPYYGGSNKLYQLDGKDDPMPVLEYDGTGPEFGYEGPMERFFSPDGSMLFCAGPPRVFDLQQDTIQTITLSDVTEAVAYALWTADKRHLVVVTRTSQILVYNVNALGNEKPRELWGHVARLNLVRNSPDGRWLLSADIDGEMRIWDLQSLNPNVDVRMLRGHGPSRTIFMGAVMDATFLGKSRRVVSVGGDQTVRLWDFSDDEQRVIESKTLFGHSSDFLQYCNADVSGQTVLTTDAVSGTRLWDLTLADPTILPQNLKFDSQEQGAQENNFVAVRRDGKEIAVASGQSVAFWTISRIEQPSPDRTIVVDGDVTWMKYMPGGQLFVGCTSGDGLIYETQTGQLQKRLKGRGEWLTHVTFDENASRIAGVNGALLGWIAGKIQIPDDVANSLPSAEVKVIVWDIDSTEPVFEQQVAWPCQAPLLSPDGTVVVTRSQEHVGVYRLGNKADDYQELLVMENASSFAAAAVSFDNRRLAIFNSLKNDVELYDLTSKETPLVPAFKLKLGGEMRTVMTSLHFTGDGKSLLGGNMADGDLRKWNLHTPEREPEIFKGHRIGIFAIDSDPNSSSILSISHSEFSSKGFSSYGEIIVWPIDDPDAKRSRFALPCDAPLHVDFSDDYQTIVTVSHDHVIRVWDLSIDSLLTKAYAAAGRELTPEERQQFMIDEIK